MLDFRAKLCQNVVGNVLRRLGNEHDADAFRPDEAHGLDDLVEELLRCTVEQEMRFVEEEHELGLVDITYFWELLEEFGEQPHDEC